MNPWDQDEVVARPWDQDEVVEVHAKRRGASGTRTDEVQPAGPSSGESLATFQKDAALPGSTIVPAAKAVGGGLWNAAREAGIGLIENNPVTAGPEWLVNKGKEILTGEKTPTVAETVSEVVPKYENPDENLAESLLREAAEWLPGIIAGGKGAQQIIPNLPSITSKFLKFLGMGVGAEAGGSFMSANPDSKEVVVGEDSMASERWGFNLPDIETDVPGMNDFSQKRLNDKLELFADSLVTSGLVTVGVAPLKFAANVIGGIGSKLKAWQSLPAQEQKAGTALIEVLGDINPYDSNAVRTSKMKGVIADLKKNKDFVVKLGNTDPAVGDVAYKKDTIGAKIEQLNPETQGSQIAELESIRTSALSGKSPELSKALDNPVKGLEGTLDRMYDTRGGSDNIPYARDVGITKAEDLYVEPVKKELFDATERLAQNSEGVEGLIRNDPTFGPLLEKLGKTVNIDFSNLSREPLATIRTKIDEASRIMTAEKDRLYNAIGPAPIDQEGLKNFLGTYGEALPADVRKQLEGLFDSNTIDWTNPDAKATGFEKLYREVNPLITRHLNSLLGSKSNDFMKIDALRALRDHIDIDQVNFVEKSGFAPAAQSVKDAKEYFANTYSKFWRQGALEDIQKILRNPKKLDAEVESEVLIGTTLKDVDRPKYISHIADLLERSEGGATAGPMLDYALLEIAKDIQKTVNGNLEGTLTAEDAVKFSGMLDRFVPILDRVAPGRKQEINDFLNKVRTSQFDTKTIEADVLRLQEKLKSSEHLVYDDIFRDFHGKLSGNARELFPNSYESMKTLFNDKQSTERLGTIMKLVDDDPLAIQGVRAAYAKNLNDVLLSQEKTPSHAHRVDNQKLGEFLDPDSTLAKNGELVYGKAYMDMIRAIAQPVYNITSVTGVKRGAGQDTNFANREGLKAFNSVVTLIWGVLDPTAAKIRVTAGQLASKYDPEDQVKTILDKMMSDPDEFIRIAEDILKAETPVLSTEMKQRVFKALTKAGIYSESEDQFERDSQTKEAFKE